jgi:hypothetical protein
MNKIEIMKVNATTNGTAAVTYEVTATLVKTNNPNVIAPEDKATKIEAKPRDKPYLNAKYKAKTTIAIPVARVICSNAGCSADVT